MLRRHLVEIGGRGFVLEGPDDPDALVRLGESVGEASPGYWAHLWDSSVALAEHVAGSGMVGPGVRVLEIGCGLGLVGIVCAWRGADVLMTDFNPLAVEAARRNCALNGVGARCEVMDWNSPSMGLECDVLLAADVLYDGVSVAPIAALVGGLGCVGLVADPLRPASAGAEEEFRRAGLRVWSAPLRAGRLMVVQR